MANLGATKINGNLETQGDAFFNRSITVKNDLTVANGLSVGHNSLTWKGKDIMWEKIRSASELTSVGSGSSTQYIETTRSLLSTDVVAIEISATSSTTDNTKILFVRLSSTSTGRAHNRIGWVGSGYNYAGSYQYALEISRNNKSIGFSNKYYTYINGTNSAGTGSVTYYIGNIWLVSV